MYQTTTYLIKEQVAGASIRQLLLLYGAELENESVNNILVNNNSVTFSKGALNWEFNRYYNQFASFSKGEIKIEERGTEYVIDFRADTGRIVTVPAVFTSVLSLFFFVLSGFNVAALLLGCAVFALLVAASFINMSVMFPVYFIGLRNSIEKQVALAKNR